MKLKRNYLTANEIGVIVENMLTKQSVYEQEMVKYGIIGQLLVEDLDIEDKDCNDIYTELIENGIYLDEEVKNIAIVDNIVEKEISVVKVIEAAVLTLNEKLDEGLSKFDADKLKETLVELQTMAKG